MLKPRSIFETNFYQAWRKLRDSYQGTPSGTP